MIKFITKLISSFPKKNLTGATIPPDFFHARTHKIAAYNAVTHRAFSIPLLGEVFKNQLLTIKSIVIQMRIGIDFVSSSLQSASHPLIHQTSVHN